MTSLRTRLSLSTAVVGAAVFLLAAAFIYGAVRSSLWNDFDRALEAEARSLAADAEQKGPQVEFEVEELLLAKFSRAEAPEYFQVWVEEDDAVVARSPALKDQNLPHIPGRAGQVSHRFVELPDGRRGRLATFTFRPTSTYDPEDEDDEPPPPAPPLTATLAVAAGAANVDQALSRLAWMLLGVSVAGVAALILLQFAMVRRGLRPIDRLAAEIEGLDAQRLASRVSPAAAPLELTPVVAKLNDLLQRLAAAFQREQSFTSDVAHELRTPVAGIRAQLDVALAKDRSVPEYQEVLGACRNICQDMQRMIESLLAVARLDADRLPAIRMDVSLSEALRQCWTHSAEAARARDLDVQWDLHEHADVFVDPQHLRLIACNLLQNAVSYCNPGGAVVVQSQARAGRVTLSVTNSGSQVAAADAERTFDRLWRGDSSRTDAASHTGLGLTIVEKLVALNGGTAQVKTVAGGDFKVVVDFPASANSMRSATKDACPVFAIEG